MRLDGNQKKETLLFNEAAIVDPREFCKGGDEMQSNTQNRGDVWRNTTAQESTGAEK